MVLWLWLTHEGIENQINLAYVWRNQIIENFMHEKADLKIVTNMKRHYLKVLKMVLVCFVVMKNKFGRTFFF